MKTTNNIEFARDQNLRHSMAAMRRAAKRAREIAISTHTALIIAKEGKWMRIHPGELVQEEQGKYGSSRIEQNTDGA
jgi:hypothetical protein